MITNNDLEKLTFSVVCVYDAIYVELKGEFLVTDLVVNCEYPDCWFIAISDKDSEVLLQAYVKADKIVHVGEYVYMETNNGYDVRLTVKNLWT